MNSKLLVLLLIAPACGSCQIFARLFPSDLPKTVDLIVETVVSDANFAVDIAGAPDGRIFYTEKASGRIRVIKDGALLPTAFATLPVNSFKERGLLGIALHPDFLFEPYVYVCYSRSSTGAPTTTQDEISDYRVVRFLAAGDVALGSEDLLLSLPVGHTGIHNGGIIRFGGDDKLYISVGDLGLDGNGRDLTGNAAKIMRINPDGTIPSDNPFGSDSPIYATGVRNTFGLCVDADGRLFGHDNGSNNHDEVNILESGLNYGWDLVTGKADDAVGDPSGEVAYANAHPEYRDPIIDKDDGSVGATGMSFIGNDLYGTSVNGSVVYAEWGLNRVLRIVVTAGGSVDSQTVFVDNLPDSVNGMGTAADGAIWLATPTSVLKIAPATP
jgi:glucose/arabinose dehydrogenase